MRVLRWPTRSRWSAGAPSRRDASRRRPTAQRRTAPTCCWRCRRAKCCAWAWSPTAACSCARRGYRRRHRSSARAWSETCSRPGASAVRLGRARTISACSNTRSPRSTLVLALLVLLRLLSIALALLQYYGFRLTEHGRRLTVERGLLARLRTSASRRRIQAWTLREGVLHRWFKRRSLQVDTAGGRRATGQQPRALRELAPIATPQRLRCADRTPAAATPAGRAANGSRLHPRSRRRLFLPAPWFPLLVATALCWRFGGWGCSRCCGCRGRRSPRASTRGARAMRSTNAWSPCAAAGGRATGASPRLDKLQALRLARGPLDRRCGMATLWLDTAGARRDRRPLRIRASARSRGARVAAIASRARWRRASCAGEAQPRTSSRHSAS